MSANCLNCDTPLQGSYCHKCGQKSSTHRITFAKFIQHDLMHGLFHLDKGVLYTLKGLIYRPGYTAKTFIAGKRVLHYNIFALFIIIIALKTLVDLQFEPKDMFESYTEKGKHSDDIINNTIHHYYKLLYLLIIPILSVFSRLFLGHLKYNFVEHIVLNCFLLAGGFFYTLVFSLIGYLSHFGMGILNQLVMGIYIFIGYYQVCKGSYSFLNFLWRGLSILILFTFALLVCLIIIIEVFYGGMFYGKLSL